MFEQLLITRKKHERVNFEKLSRETGILAITLWKRVKQQGMTVEEAINTPLKNTGRRASKNAGK